MLQWVLIKRLEALLERQEGEFIGDITKTLQWTFDESGDIVRRLDELGYERELSELFDLSVPKTGRVTRRSDLEGDLRLLGLLDDYGKGTARLRCCLEWLHARVLDPDGSGTDVQDLGSCVRWWLGTDGMDIVRDPAFTTTQDHNMTISKLSAALLMSATGPLLSLDPGSIRCLNEITTKDAPALRMRIARFTNDTTRTIGECSLAAINRLVPQVHIIVRAFWTTPVRWLFVPVTQEPQMSDGASVRARIRSALIIMVEDDVTSLPYRSFDSSGSDTVLAKLYESLALLMGIANIEEELLEEDIVLAQQMWDVQRDQIDWLHHLIRTIRRLLTADGSDSSAFARGLLTNVENSLITLPPNRLTAKKQCVAVPVEGAVLEAANAFRSYFESHKGTKVSVICKPGTCIRISSLSDDYMSETEASRLRRGEADLSLLVLDLLAQRASQAEPEVKLELTEESIRVITSIPFRPEQLWNSTQGLNFWGKKRGFYLTFAIAQALGSLHQQVANEAGCGIINIEFDRKRNDRC